MSNNLINATKLTQPEEAILNMIRNMDLFDTVTIKYVKRGELMWQLIKSHKGVYRTGLPSDDDMV